MIRLILATIAFPLFAFASDRSIVLLEEDCKIVGGNPKNKSITELGEKRLAAKCNLKKDKLICDMVEANPDGSTSEVKGLRQVYYIAKTEGQKSYIRTKDNDLRMLLDTDAEVYRSSMAFHNFEDMSLVNRNCQGKIYSEPMFEKLIKAIYKNKKSK